MSDKHTILLVSAAACVGAAWYVRTQDPTFQYAPVITGIVVAATIYVYWKTTPQKKCTSTDVHGNVTTGSCELDSDCNTVDPDGKCYKDTSGACACICSPGYSGKNCEVKGIPWNDPNCMGPNSQSPKNQSGLCVCPSEHWQSGTVGGQTIQCLTCQGAGTSQEWGPHPASKSAQACTAQWKQIDMVSNVCVYRQATDPTLGCKDIAGQYETGFPNYQGVMPSVTPTKNSCIGASCKCSSYSKPYGTARSVCSVTGWVDPSVTAQNCQSPGINNERACSDYQCAGFTG